MMNKFLTSSVAETYAIASKFAISLKQGATVCLNGELGSGKTTFTQGLGNYFGIKRITSPTFIIMREYPIFNSTIITRLFHLDLYRLKDKSDLKAFDLQEIYSDPHNLVIIEWPNNIPDILPQDRIDINISIINSTSRQIEIISRRHQ